jgi:hypothetical protein
MISGTTEPKKYSKAEILEMLRLYMQKASETYQEENKRVAEKLAKHGITPDEFVSYCRSKEPKRVKQ